MPACRGSRTVALGEFDLIARHLTGLGAARDDVVLGVGDDAALLRPPAGCRLAVASAGTGPGGAGDAADAAAHCLEQAFSRLDEAGATPAWVTVALTLEDGDEPWVARFAASLSALCARHRVAVVGGDTTAGARAVTLFAVGTIAP